MKIITSQTKQIPFKQQNKETHETKQNNFVQKSRPYILEKRIQFLDWFATKMGFPNLVDKTVKSISKIEDKYIYDEKTNQLSLFKLFMYLKDK